MDNKIKNRIGLTLYFFAAINILTCLVLSSITAVWFDEIYSLVFSFRPSREMIALTAKDVHPPFYYLILRIFFIIFDKLIPSMSSEQVGKIVTCIPFILMMIYSASTIKKKWGFLTSGTFIFCILFMPEARNLDIRMYSWSTFIIFGLGLHFSNVITDFFNEKKSSVINYLAIFIYSVSALYTHYFAAIAVFWVYFGAVVMFFIGYLNKRKTQIQAANVAIRDIIITFMVGIISIICYIPWLAILFSQVSTVKESYWISPIGPKTPYNTAMFLFRAPFSNNIFYTVIGLLFFSLIVFLLYRNVIKAKSGNKESIMALYLFSVLPMVAITGYILSIIIRPIFIYRYLLPAIGLFWLSISIMLCDYFGDVLSEKKSQKYEIIAAVLIVIVICIDAVSDFAFIYQYDTNIGKREHEFTDMLYSIDEDTIIVTNLDHIQGVVSYLLNTDRRILKNGEKDNTVADYNIWLYMSDEKPLLSQILPGFCYIEDGNEIKDMAQDGKKVILLEHSDSKDIYSNLVEEYGLNFEFKGKYLYEDYHIDAYTLNF